MSSNNILNVVDVDIKVGDLIDVEETDLTTGSTLVYDEVSDTYIVKKLEIVNFDVNVDGGSFWFIMLIRFKRSSNTSAPSNLEFGELAYSSNTESLFIGNANNEVISIGGKRNPGYLTPNAEIIVSPQGDIDFIKVEDSYQNKFLIANSYGNTGDILLYNANTNSLYWAQPVIQEDFVYTYINFFFPYDVEGNTIVANYPFGLTYTLLENFEDSVAYTENPAQTTPQVFSILKNNSQIGTITFDVGEQNGTFSASAQTVFGRNVDILKIKALSNTDTTFKNFTISLEFIKRYPNEYIPPVIEDGQSFLVWNSMFMTLNTSPLVYTGNT